MALLLATELVDEERPAVKGMADVNARLGHTILNAWV